MTMDSRSPAQGLMALAIGTALSTYFSWVWLRRITGGDADPARETVFLVLCGAWLLYAGLRLIRIGRRVPGGATLLALVAGAWGHRGISAGSRSAQDASYVAAAGATLWFFLLTVMLVILSWRASRDDRRPPGS